MPLYYFDVFDRFVTRDDVGQDCADHGAAQRVAFQSLPTIAADEMQPEDDKRTFAVLVKDADGHPIYTAMMSFAGQWLTMPGET